MVDLAHSTAVVIASQGDSSTIYTDLDDARLLLVLSQASKQLPNLQSFARQDPPLKVLTVLMDVGKNAFLTTNMTATTTRMLILKYASELLNTAPSALPTSKAALSSFVKGPRPKPK